ncbi:MAG TPA: flavin reductase [Nocardioidaceae bacterium]|nr:flavin reductase [Nocardioidaceae bacterium]
MSRVAVVGAGQSGAQLALGLLQNGYDVTLLNDRTPDEVRAGRVLSSQCMFDSALQTERVLGLDQWAAECPDIDGISMTVAGNGGPPTQWLGRLDAPAQSVDQRVKLARWMEEFEDAGGRLRIQAASPHQVDDLTRHHDLVVVATGKGDLGRIFAPDRARSPYDKPQRALALTYVNGMKPRDDLSVVSFNVAPGVGEYFTFAALGPDGPCDIMVFEGVCGGPMDCWDDVRTPEQHLNRSLQILKTFFPQEYARCGDVTLTDEGGVLRGRLTPTVRKPIATLPSGAPVLGMADAVILNDPITGQGSNNAAKASSFYLDNILGRGDRPFDEAWMQSTFESFWRGWAQWVVRWTNSVLAPPEPHLLDLYDEAAQLPTLADQIANGFDDPRTLYQWWFDPEDAKRLVEEARSAQAARFEPRELRRAFGQYTTGVTVVTARGEDGHRIGVTANSFTSVSIDPPLVLWCPAKTTPSLAALGEATHFAVNILASDQHDLSRQFATPSEDKFAGVSVTEGLHGVPLIDGSVASFECRTVQFIEAGDHVICLGEVEKYEVAGGEPLVFHAGGYQVPTKHPDL